MFIKSLLRAFAPIPLLSAQQIEISSAIAIAAMQRPEQTVYLQFSESGAMGSPGDIVIGIYTSKKLVCYSGNYHDSRFDNLPEFSQCLDEMYALVQSTIPRREPPSFNFDGSAFDQSDWEEQQKENSVPKAAKLFNGAFDMGNYLLLNKSFHFHWKENDIFFTTDEARFKILLSSAPVKIFGPLLFEQQTQFR
jgi:hypothetical protein